MSSKIYSDADCGFNHKHRENDTFQYVFAFTETLFSIQEPIILHRFGTQYALPWHCYKGGFILIIKTISYCLITSAYGDIGGINTFSLNYKSQRRQVIAMAADQASVHWMGIITGKTLSEF